MDDRRGIIHQNSTHGNSRFIHFTPLGIDTGAFCVGEMHKAVDESCDREETFENVENDDEG
jgi:hypothetical protein